MKTLRHELIIPLNQREPQARKKKTKEEKIPTTGKEILIIRSRRILELHKAVKLE